MGSQEESALDRQIKFCEDKLKNYGWLMNSETHLMLAGITQHLRELRDLREVLNEKHGRVKEAKRIVEPTNKNSSQD